MTHDVNEVRAFILRQERFYITGHINPDGDAIGACLGLGLALEKIGKKVRVILESFHSKYNVIPGNHLIYEYKGDMADTVGFEDHAIICVDCADLGRLPESARSLVTNSENTLCIDHHFSNTNFAKYNFIDSNCSSTCEMIYRILDAFMDIDTHIASAIYAGMVCDTGAFRHAATSRDTLEVSGKLLNLNIPFTEIYTELISLRTYTQVKLLARVIDACQRSDDAKIVYACVPLTMMAGFGDTPDATTHDLENVVEFLLNIRRAKVAVLIYERPDGKSKLSLRSRKINVGAIAQKFGGGGHNLAAGATVDGSVYEIKDKVLPMIEKALSGVYSV